LAERKKPTPEKATPPGGEETKVKENKELGPEQRKESVASVASTPVPQVAS
jgi:hypothetical protein